MIDFEQNMVKSKDLRFENLSVPKCVVYLNNLTCINKYGTTFILDKLTLKFYRSGMFMPGVSSDSVFVAHGSCEKF